MSSDYDLLLKRLHLKVTPKRLAILKILDSETVYLSPEDVWARLKSLFGKIGLPTVYRNLEELAQGGVIARIIHPSRQLYYYYCGNNTHHHHFICISCNSVQELDYCPEVEIRQKIEQQLRGKVLSHLFQVNGLCSRCIGHDKVQTNGG